ncbi:MAG: efflux RND transporter periplasmic adaptor subunit [Verrucomicrobiae bacterium]|nr:efflux RND transporter periplasmic adaptor subunit [Verrucomicrobiae bacterium]
MFKIKHFLLALLVLLFAISLQTAVFAQEKEDHDHHEHADHELESNAHQEHKDDDSDHDHSEHGEEDDHEGHDHGTDSDSDEHEGHDHGSESDSDEHDDHGHGDEHGGPIELSPRDMEDFGIQLAEAGPGVIHDELRLPGEISINENAMGHVSPRFDGVVTKIHKRLGDPVKAGDLMAEMESNETLRPFSLKAPIDGTIVEFHIAPGESVTVGDVVYTVVDTSTVWADLRVYQRDLPKLHVGQKINISAGHDYPEFHGEISYMGPVIEETTRTGLVRATIPNDKGLYRPGLFVIGNVLLDASHLPLVLPRSAILSMDGKDVVFVQSEDGHGFEKTEVVLGKSDSQNVEIISGIHEGEIYVKQGGFFLKADSQKEDFGDGHAH